MRRKIVALAPGGGYIFSGGHSLQADVPPANIVALFDTAYEVGRYPLAHYVHLYRNALVYEDAKKLELCWGVQPDWLMEKFATYLRANLLSLSVDSGRGGSG